MKETISILFIWKVRDELKKYLGEGLANLPVSMIFTENIEEKNLIRLSERVQIIVGWRPTPALLTAAKQLQLFINPGAGVQHLIKPFNEATLVNDITIVNGHGNNYFTAQHTVAILLSLLNRVIPHHRWMSKGKWRTGDKEAASIPLRNMNVGLLGYGHVNQLVHRFLAGFDINFAILRKNWSKLAVKDAPASCKKFGPSQLHDFLRYVDLLIIAVPLTPSTKDLISIPELELLGEEGILINVGRGEVVNEAALFQSLEQGTIKGAAIDVWYDYQIEADAAGKKYPYHHPFHELDNIVLSPHRAASPMSDLGRWDEVIENIRRYASNDRPFLNVVDLEAGY